VLAVCLVALGVDQLFLAPGEAAASEQATPAVPPSAAPPIEAASEVAGAAAIDLSIPETIVASNLHAAMSSFELDATDAPDAFAVPEQWLPAQTPAVPRHEPRTSAERFAASHTLSATMASSNSRGPARLRACPTGSFTLTTTMAGSDGGYAVVNGRLLRVGESMDGFQLASVSKRSAVFVADGERVTLMMDQPIGPERPNNGHPSR
jgi:hypothetical protein